MIDFEYLAPESLDDAVATLRQRGAGVKVLAGGTDVLVQMREGLRNAELVLDVKKIPELTEIRCSAQDGLQLGAATACLDIYDHSEIVRQYPAIIDAARILGGWQIQSRASLGGNLCNASPAADSAPPMMAYNAICRTLGPAGEREIPVGDFFVAPGKNALYEGELLVSLHLPPQPPRSGAAYQRFIPRNEMDIAVAGIACWVQLDESSEKIAAAQIAACAVAPTPRYAVEAAAWLEGQPATEESYAQAGELARAIASPIDDMRGTSEYRVHLIGVLTKRMLAKAVSRARGGKSNGSEHPTVHLP